MTDMISNHCYKVTLGRKHKQFFLRTIVNSFERDK